MDNKNLLKGTMVYSLMNLVTKMGSFVFLPIITRLLTQEEFGIVGTLGPITSLFTVILGLGLYNAQMKKYVDLKDSEDEFGSYMFSSTMIIVVFNVLTYMFLFTPLAQKMFSYIVDLSKVSYYPLIIVSVLIATANAFNNLATTLFRMKRMYMKVAIGSVVSLFTTYILAIYFIKYLKWGVFGAALATSIARGSVVIMCVYLIFISKKQWISLNIKKMKFDYFTAKRIIKVGIPAAIEQLALRFGMLIFEIMVISLGNLNYAAHKIALTAESFSFNLGFAVSLAATALVGQELGRNSPKNALKNGYICTIIGLIIMFSMGLLFFIAPNLLISLFTDDPQVISLSTMALRLVSICQPFLAISMILSGALRGAGATKSVLFITFFGIYLVRIPITYVFLNIFNMGLAGAWIVMTIDLIFRSSLCFYTFKKGKWKYLKV